MINIERQKKNFENHVASFSDYGNIKVLDFKNPESNEYRIRFMFEEDYCRCHISGDLGSLVATNYKNMTFEGFKKDFVHNTGYFEGKIDCCERSIYAYDEELAEKELREKLEEIAEYDDAIDIDDVVYDMMRDFEGATGFGSIAYAALSEYDSDCWEYISDLGKEETGILDLYMLAFELATEQLEAQTKEVSA